MCERHEESRSGCFNHPNGVRGVLGTDCDSSGVEAPVVELWLSDKGKGTGNEADEGV